MQPCGQHDSICCLAPLPKPRFLKHIQSSLKYCCTEHSPVNTDLSQWTPPPIETRPPRRNVQMNFTPPSPRRTNTASTAPPNIISARASAPLLSSPRPRATWRRSLQEPLSSQRHEDIDDVETRNRRITFEISCALPPLYLDRPPAYSTNDFPIQTPEPSYSRPRVTSPDHDRTYLDLQQCLPPSPWAGGDFTALPVTSSSITNATRRSTHMTVTRPRTKPSSRMQYVAYSNNNGRGQSSTNDSPTPPQRPPRTLKKHRRGTPSR